MRSTGSGFPVGLSLFIGIRTGQNPCKWLAFCGEQMPHKSPISRYFILSDKAFTLYPEF